MKKILTALLALLLVLASLCGCGGNTKQGTEEPVSSDETSSYDPWDAADVSSEKPVDENSAVTYISDISFQHNDAEDEYIVFFGLKDSLQKYVSGSGKAEVAIYDDSKNKLFGTTFSFAKKDFSNWTNRLWGTDRYLCGLYIKESKIPHSSSYSGTIAVKVSLNNGIWFEEQKISTYDLPTHDWSYATCTSPKKCKTCGKTEGNAEGHNYYSSGECSKCGAMDPKVNSTLSKCSLTLPSLPKEVSYRSSYSGTVYHSVRVTNISYKFEYEGDGKISLTAYFSGTKTYDSDGGGQSGACYIGWKLYDPNGNVLETGTFYSPSISVGESFANQEVTLMYSWNNNAAPGKYRLEILDSN